MLCKNTALFHFIVGSATKPYFSTNNAVNTKRTEEN